MNDSWGVNSALLKKLEEIELEAAKAKKRVDEHLLEYDITKKCTQSALNELILKQSRITDAITHFEDQLKKAANEEA